MKKQIGISMLMLIAFSLGVTFTANATSYHKYVKSEYCKVGVSKTVNYVFEFSPATMEHYEVSLNRYFTYVSYEVGKVQNKALPLSKRLWLLNNQIALK